MPMRPPAARDVAMELLPKWDKNREEMNRLDRWHRGKLDHRDLPWLTDRATNEYRALRELAQTPWAGLVVKATTQALFVDGFRDGSGDDDVEMWRWWQANGFDARQVALHETAGAAGLGYVSVLPGRDPLTGEALPQARDLSARSCLTVYDSPAHDEWALYAMTGETIRAGLDGDRRRYRLFDDDAVYTFDSDDSQGLTFVTLQEHGVGVCPVVRFSPFIDSDGRARGEVEPYIDMFARINQTTFDRLVMQRFGAWVVRWATGLSATEKATDEEQEKADKALKLAVGQDDMLVAPDKDVKFGTLQASDLRPILEARSHDIRDMAAMSQTPPHALLGEVVNIGAEALAAIEAGHQRKVALFKVSLGESYERMFRLAAWIMGDEARATDVSAQVRWRDVESRSLAQVADALGKFAQMLGIPPQALWEEAAEAIGATQQDVEQWKTIAEEQDAFGGMLAQLAGGAEPAPEPEPVA